MTYILDYELRRVCYVDQVQIIWVVIGRVWLLFLCILFSSIRWLINNLGLFKMNVFKYIMMKLFRVTKLKVVSHSNLGPSTFGSKVNSVAPLQIINICLHISENIVYVYCLWMVKDFVFFLSSEYLQIKIVIIDTSKTDSVVSVCQGRVKIFLLIFS